MLESKSLASPKGKSRLSPTHHCSQAPKHLGRAFYWRSTRHQRSDRTPVLGVGTAPTSSCSPRGPLASDASPPAARNITWRASIASACSRAGSTRRASPSRARISRPYALELDPARVEALLGQKPAQHVCRCLVPAQIAMEDAQVAALLGSMALEVEPSCPAGALYGQSLSLALAAYLAGRILHRARQRPSRSAVCHGSSRSVWWITFEQISIAS